MKMSIDVDCTPEEARRFLGLPDVTALQEEFLEMLRDRLTTGLTAMDPEQMAKSWMAMGMGQGLPQGLKEWEAVQKSFWTQMASMAGKGSSEDDRG